MSSRRWTEEDPGCLRNRGFSLVALIEGPPNSESHPAMIGAGCPVLPLQTGAGCLLHSLSSAGMSLSSLRCSDFQLLTFEPPEEAPQCGREEGGRICEHLRPWHRVDGDGRGDSVARRPTSEAHTSAAAAAGGYRRTRLPDLLLHGFRRGRRSALDARRL